MPRTDWFVVGSDQHLTAAQREERDLQQAVAMSLQQNLQDFPPQETGVTVRTEKPHFGRATRDHYDEHSWAMTLFNPSAREVIISPDPEDRRRRGEEPAFLRPSEESNYLAGFLTILHSIPLAREALLLRDKTAYDYGHDPQWWNGQPIKTPRVVSLDHAQEGDDDADELLYETQRLMAFLDGTRRAFGSTDALVGLKTMSGYDPDGGISKFLEGWQQAAVRAASDNPLAGIFASHALKRPLSRVESPITKTFFILDPNVEPEHGQTLYDVLDRAIWSDVPGEELDDVWLEHVGDVLTIRLEITETQVDSLDVKIPAVFYPDRYMEACREVTREIRLKRLEVIKQINRLEELAARLQTSGPAAECGLTNKQLLRKAAEAALTALPRYLPQDMTDMLTPEVENAGQALAAELDAIVAQLDAKLKGMDIRRDASLPANRMLVELSAKRQEALESLRKYSKPLTEPSSDPNEPPNRKYTLRGVCTAPHITYVLRRKQPPKTDDHMNGSATSNEWEWWRISFSVDDGKTQQAAKAGSQSRFATPSHADIIGYTAKKVREIEVLRAARDESANVLLVYANENAVGFQDGPAPPALQVRIIGSKLDRVSF